MIFIDCYQQSMSIFDWYRLGDYVRITVASKRNSLLCSTHVVKHSSKEYKTYRDTNFHASQSRRESTAVTGSDNETNSKKLVMSRLCRVLVGFHVTRTGKQTSQWKQTSHWSTMGHFIFYLHPPYWRTKFSEGEGRGR